MSANGSTLLRTSVRLLRVLKRGRWNKKGHCQVLGGLADVARRVLR